MLIFFFFTFKFLTIYIATLSLDFDDEILVLGMLRASAVFYSIMLSFLNPVLL